MRLRLRARRPASPAPSERRGLGGRRPSAADGPPMVTSKLRVRDHLLGLALGTAYVVLLVVTARDLGFARDEGFYFHAAEDSMRWFDRLEADPAAAISRA